MGPAVELLHGHLSLNAFSQYLHAASLYRDLCILYSHSNLEKNLDQTHIGPNRSLCKHVAGLRELRGTCCSVSMQTHHAPVIKHKPSCQASALPRNTAYISDASIFYSYLLVVLKIHARHRNQRETSGKHPQRTHEASQCLILCHNSK